MTIKDSGERTEFATGAVRDMHKGKGRMDLLPWHAILEVSKHCEDGASKYGEHNVDKGIPVSSLCDSAARHLAKLMCGMDDEDHLRAAAWNILWALEMREAKPDMFDLYAWQQKVERRQEQKKSDDDLHTSISDVLLPMMERVTCMVRGAVENGKSARWEDANILDDM